MEDNISKLMQIVGGILIGVILLSLISFFFSSIGLWPAEEDQAESAEQLAKFNLEYEVYEKNGMYGVDVISCLNKAKSNNEKYAEGGRFLIGNEYGKNFYIDVWVRLKESGNYLEESVTVYHFNNNGVEEPYMGTTNKIQLEDGTQLTLTSAGFSIDKNLYTHFSRTNQDVYEVWPDTINLKFNDASDLRPGGGTNSYDGNKYYSLLDNPDTGNSENNLVKLINLSNKSDTGSLDRTVTNTTGKNLKIWSRIIWKTALSDFKSRRFKCDFVGYNSKTGRVNQIIFSEI